MFMNISERFVRSFPNAKGNISFWESSRILMEVETYRCAGNGVRIGKWINVRGGRPIP